MFIIIFKALHKIQKIQFYVDSLNTILQSNYFNGYQNNVIIYNSRNLNIPKPLILSVIINRLQYYYDAVCFILTRIISITGCYTYIYFKEC